MWLRLTNLISNKSLYSLWLLTVGDSRYALVTLVLGGAIYLTIYRVLVGINLLSELAVPSIIYSYRRISDYVLLLRACQRSSPVKLLLPQVIREGVCWNF
jgi:hypothetical protein